MRHLIPLLLIMGMLPACRLAGEAAGEKASSSAVVVDTVTYDVSQTISLVNDGPEQPEKHNLWVALIGDQMPYQQLLSRTFQPSDYVLVSDEYGNQYAEFDLKDMAPGESAEITIDYEVAVNELRYDLAKCSGDMPDDFVNPELHIESNNPQIMALAKDLAAAQQTVCEQVRAFYDYTGANLVYTFNGANWGAQAALGKMGADCSEYSSLLIALSRAKGIPARYVEGLLFLDKADRAPADNAEIARQEHAWVEVYFPGTGWAPIDPTLGRSTLTREQHFARYSPNHIIVTNGRSPSTLRGASYWSHLYWPGDSTTIRVENASWSITPRPSG
jgi:transglutaminase-like putative cysteine protease